MSERLATASLARIASLTDAPPQTRVDRNFGLPTGLYAATVGLYFAFIALMGSLFAIPEMAIPLAIFAIFIVMAFGVPALWTRMNPANDSKPLSWSQFSSRGIQTLTGPLTAGEASVQVLILPVLILLWGVSIAVIMAFH